MSPDQQMPVCSSEREGSREFFKPHQFGVACKQWCREDHGLRACANNNKHGLDDDFVVLKVDMKNAFNMVLQEAILSECSKHFPELLPRATWCYMYSQHPICGTLWAAYIRNKGFSRVILLVLCFSPWF